MIYKPSVAWLALVPVSLASCGGGDTTSETTGHYDLDVQHFANHMADKLIEIGRAPAGFRNQLVNQMQSSKFSLDLHEDGTFEAEQKMGNQSHAYSGSWTLIGSQIRLDQTHEDGSEVVDTMSGTLEHGQLTLIEQDEGTELTIILRRANPAAAASPGR